jgi:putative transposase
MQEKKTNGIKRHFMVDVLGLLICIVVHAANIQERAGAKMLLAKASNKGLPRLEKVLADDGYSGKPMEEHVRKEYGWEFESVKRTELHKFVVQPRRWVVERTIGWMNNFRALSKDYDTDSKTSEANILLGSIYYLSRRLTEEPVIKEDWICEKNEAKLAHLIKKTTQIA